MLKGIFGGARGKKEEKEAEDSRSRAVFDRTAFNPDACFPADALETSFCRTRALAGDPGDGRNWTWIEAVRISRQSGLWHLVRVERRQNLDTVKSLPPEAMIRVLKHAPEKMDFPSAVKAMARFENELLSGERLTGPTKEELGDRHYQAAALREGIMFDAEGMPQPSVNGVPLDGSVFEDDFCERAAAAHQAGKPPQARETSLLEIAGALGTGNLMDVLENIATLKRFLKELAETQFALSFVLRENSPRRFDNMHFFFEKNANPVSQDRFMHVGQRLFAARRELATASGQDTPFYKALSVFFMEYQLYVLLVILKDAYGMVEKAPFADKGFYQDVIENRLKPGIGGCCQRIEAEGGQPGLLKNFMNRVLLKRTDESAEEIKNTIARMGRDLDSLSSLTPRKLQQVMTGDYFGLFEQQGTPTASRANAAPGPAPGT